MMPFDSFGGYYCRNHHLFQKTKNFVWLEFARPLFEFPMLRFELENNDGKALQCFSDLAQKSFLKNDIPFAKLLISASIINVFSEILPARMK